MQRVNHFFSTFLLDNDEELCLNVFLKHIIMWIIEEDQVNLSVSVKNVQLFLD